MLKKFVLIWNVNEEQEICFSGFNEERLTTVPVNNVTVGYLGLRDKYSYLILTNCICLCIITTCNQY
jgi:hypothetical protein